MFYPDEKTYLELARRYNTVPVSLEWPSDTETPITVYLKAARGRRSFLLESAEGSESIGRYSIIGIDPDTLITSYKNTTKIETREKTEIFSGNPLNAIEKLLSNFKSPVLEDMPRFYSGAVGFLGYDLARGIERLPDFDRKSSGVPDCMLMTPELTIIIDHLKHTMRIVVNTRPAERGREEYARAADRIRNTIKLINEGAAPAGLVPTVKSPDRTPGLSITRQDFMDKVLQAKEYIMAGDILQVVLSRRIDLAFRGNPFMVYRRLRRNNPSPYLYYIDMGNVVMAGSSPEMLVRVEDNCVETRPIAGTRPRGQNRQEDLSLAADLLSDIKERAEHVMLVDLGRNDLGRVSKPGTVKVSQFMEVEKYSHVMHLVSSVKGELKDGTGVLDVLKSCFPAGTVSGAPKLRAMEIIEELETERRGPYAGAVGYLGFNGSMDTAIAIRTIVFYNGIASVQVGAGIVADSDPAREFEETENKALALLRTLDEEEDTIAANY